MKCNLTICTCNLNGGCGYKGKGLKCQRIARKCSGEKKDQYGNFYKEDYYE